MLFNIKLFIISSLILLLLDFSYLFVNQKWYKNETNRMQGKELKLKWFGVFIRYLSQIIGLNLFVLQVNGGIIKSFLFGLIIYGNYIGTNYATINIFDEKLAIFDLLKGGIIMALTTYITYNILNVPF
jgi:uncharacterized membrane protein